MRVLKGLAALCMCVAPALAQWELGVLGGAGFRPGIDVQSASGSAALSFRPGPVWGFYGGQTEHGFLAGEMHYLNQSTNMRVKSGSGEATMDGRTHVLHFDLLVHTHRADAALRPFVAIGGGVKVFEGLGPDRAVQPLSSFVMLTRTRDVKPVISPAVGLKANIRKHLIFRAELRYLGSPRPEKVAAPSPLATMKGWVHDFVPLVGVAAVF